MDELGSMLGPPFQPNCIPRLVETLGCQAKTHVVHLPLYAIHIVVVVVFTHLRDVQRRPRELLKRVSDALPVSCRIPRLPGPPASLITLGPEGEHRAPR